MRADAALADRRQAVRKAARAWKRAGAVDAATLAAVETAYPDDRRRLGPVFRILAFGLSCFALLMFFGLIALCASRNTAAIAILCLFFSAVLVATTEILIGFFRRADSGLETATALLAVISAVAGLFVMTEKALTSNQTVTLILVSAAVLAAIGSWRWGSPLLAALATVSAFLLLARLPFGRAIWILLPLVAAPFALRASESADLPPAHRRSMQVVLLLALGALYVAVHVGSWDYHWLEWFADFRDEPATRVSPLRPLSILATAGVPIAIFVWGVATRRTILLNTGLIFGVLSLATLRFYVHVAPPWVVLIASGSAALLTTLLVRRLLASGADKERQGFTAEPLFQDPARRHLIEVIGAVAQFGPAARSMPAQPDKTFEGGGGGYGGGGASGDF
jgi:hypothetical protein